MCERLEKCPFYNDKMPMERGIGSIFKKKYCQGDNRLCARYRVFAALGEDAVPDYLYPNMLDISQRIIEEAKR